MGPSFDTISGAGPNGAVVHYRVTEKTNRKLESGSLYLVDSGAQYLDGTTDVTRTVAVGQPTDEMRDRFTRVLKGHIALATSRFPQGTTGSQLDVLARLPLWTGRTRLRSREPVMALGVTSGSTKVRSESPKWATRWPSNRE